MSTLPPFKGVVVARNLLEQPIETVQDEWSLDALSGRFVEISGGATTAALTVTAALIYEAQRRGTLAAWIGGNGSSFFPPDFAASGIDLEALPVVRVADSLQAARAADTLIRSGGFAAVVLDLGSRADLPMPVQTRLVGLAHKHRTAILAITRQDRSLTPRGSFASLRGETTRRRADHDCFLCEIRVFKDKRRAPGWSHAEVCRGTDGLC